MTAARKIDPSVADYRAGLASQFMRLRTRHEDVCEALASTVPADELRERALGVIRPEVRSFLSEVLTRAPLNALERSAGLLHDWSATDSLLLDRGGQEMKQLIDVALPEATWTKLGTISAKKARKEDEWARWCSAWLKEFNTHAELKPEKGRWARFFAGIEAPEWIAAAVDIATAVDNELRKREEKRRADAEARRPLTYDQVVKMKGGTVLRPGDAIAALRGTYQHPEDTVAPAPVPAPAPTPAPAPAPTSTRAPTRGEMIASMGQLEDLRDRPLVVPSAEHLDAFYRWCHDEWTAIKTHAATATWNPSIPLEPAPDAASRMEALRGLVRLRGAPYDVPSGTHSAFARWIYHEWKAIKSHANTLEWRPSAPPPAAEHTPPHETQAAPPALERRVATLEDEVVRLRSSLAFLSLNLDMQIKRAEEERETLQRQISELRDLIMQAQSTSAPASTSSVEPASTAIVHTPTDAAPSATPESTTPVETLGTTDATPIPASTAPVEAPEEPDEDDDDPNDPNEANDPAQVSDVDPAEGADETAETEETDQDNENGDAADEPDEPGAAEQVNKAHQLAVAQVTEVQRKLDYAGQLEAENAALRSTRSHLKGLFEGLSHG